MSLIHLEKDQILVRNLQPEDFSHITKMCKKVYPFSDPWIERQFNSHLKIFPEGQIVAIHQGDNQVVGYSASLIVSWDDYELNDPWLDFTDRGYFTNHDPEGGKTLYGAEVMVDPDYQGLGIGKLIYEARRQIVQHFKLLRIRAGARMRGYATYHEKMTAEEYAWHVMNFEIFDPTLSFQLKHGFKVLNIVSDYLRADVESKGYAALIEWLNPQVASEKYYQNQQKFYNKLKEKFS